MLFKIYREGQTNGAFGIWNSWDRSDLGSGTLLARRRSSLADTHNPKLPGHEGGHYMLDYQERLSGEAFSPTMAADLLVLPIHV